MEFWMTLGVVLVGFIVWKGYYAIRAAKRQAREAEVQDYLILKRRFHNLLFQETKTNQRRVR